LAHRGQGLYQELGGFAAGCADAIINADTRFRRLGSERAWMHCGWMPAIEYERCPHRGQGLNAVAALSGTGLRWDEIALFSGREHNQPAA
jgi:hypothetical protein